MTTRFAPDARDRRRGVRPLLAIALLSALATLSACAPKITDVDPDYTTLEGQYSPYARMLLWADQPVTTVIYRDLGVPEPDAADTVMATGSMQAYPPGTIRGMIVDSTVADGYEVYRYEANGGLRQLAGYNLLATRKWIGTQTEAYSFADRTPVGGTPEYVGRGIVDGIVSPGCPLTNTARLDPGGIANLPASAVWYPPTGKIKLKWDPVQDAAYYLVQVYTFRNDIQTLDEQILSGAPSPLYDGKVSDSWIGIVPPEVNFIYVGDSTRTDIATLIVRPIQYGTAVKVRVAAIGLDSRLIALTSGDPDPIKAYANGDMGIQRGVLGPGTYELFRLGATTARDTLIIAGPGGGEGGN